MIKYNVGKKLIILLLAIIILAASGLIFKDSQAIIKINDIEIEVELANKPDKKTRGLSNRNRLDKNKGILFIYEKPGFYHFWMKDMLFPIDIIWIDENAKIIDIKKDIQPETFPEKFTSSKPAQYILEVNAGFFDKNNIKIGDAVYLNPM